MAAGTRPAVGRSGLLCRLLRRLLLTHGVQVLGVHAAGLTGHVHAHKRHGCAALIAGRHLHGIALRADEMRRRTGGIHEGRVALQLLQHLFVFLVGGDTGHAEGDDLDAAEVTPLLAEDFVQGIGQLHGVAGQLGVADAVLADPGEGGLEGGQQLGFQLIVQLVAGIGLADVAADVGIEQDGVGDVIAVLAEAADAHVNVDTGTLIHHPEGHGAGGAVLVAHQLFGIKIVHPLILGSLAAEGEAVGHAVNDGADAALQLAGEQGRLGGHVISKLARLGADLDDATLIHDHHALTIGHGDDAAVGDHVVASLGIAGAAGDALLTLDGHDVFGHSFTIEIFLPLVGHHAAHAAQCCFDQSHFLSPFIVMIYAMVGYVFHTLPFYYIVSAQVNR